MEPYLDPFQVQSPNSEEKGYLVTSPEFSLKETMALGLDRIYEISQVYRSGEKGSLHTAEFLMLEFYVSGIDEFNLMEICSDLFEELELNFHSCGFSKDLMSKHSTESLFQTHLGISDSYSDLEKFCKKKYGFTGGERFDDLFFCVFLNEIEKHFQEGPYFVHSYPSELASLARVEGGRARRFEIYWKGVELGNAFYELNHIGEQRKRFEEEQDLRRKLGKEVYPIDEFFLERLEDLPDASGISIGLDRLFMIFLGHTNLKYLSPYYRGEKK